MKHTIRLFNPTHSFFDTETKLYLNFYNPSAEIEVITAAIKRGLKAGTIVDVNGTIDLSPKKDKKTEAVAEISEVEVKTEVKVEEVQQELEVKTDEVTEDAVTEEVKESVKEELKKDVAKKHNKKK